MCSFGHRLHGYASTSSNEPTTRASSSSVPLALSPSPLCTLIRTLIAASPSLYNGIYMVIVIFNVLRRVARRRFDRWGLDEARRFYAEHRGRFFYTRLVFTMANGPVEAWVLRGPDAITRWRALMGPTHLYRALSQQPSSIRAKLARSDTRNVRCAPLSPILVMVMVMPCWCCCSCHAM